MKDNFDQLKNSWQEVKKGQLSTDSTTMLQSILKHQAASKHTHLMNILILSITVIGLMAFFYFLAPMQETLSRVGIVLMIGGLLVRIIIELVSHRKAGQIDYSKNSSFSAKQTSDFFSYRKKIHGPVTFIIITLYTIGFYSLTPEFSNYFSTFWLWMMDGSYLIIGIILFLVIRKGVVQEMKDLQRINDLQSSLNQS